MAKSPHDPEEWKRLWTELAVIRRQMVALVGEITRLEDEPASFHARLWRDFYRAMLTHTVRSAMTKLLILVVAVALVPCARAATPQPLDLVIALDLTKSTDVKGPDGKTEFPHKSFDKKRTKCLNPAVPQRGLSSFAGRPQALCRWFAMKPQ